MSPENKHTVSWDLEKGVITLNGSGKPERAILMREEYVNAFLVETIKTIGEDGFRVVLRDVAKKAGASQELIENPSRESFGAFIKSDFLPVDTGKSTIPGPISWDGNGPLVNMFADTYWYILPVRYTMLLNAAMIDILAENGARAIFRNAARQAGMGMAKKALGNYGWTSLDDAMPEQDAKVFRGSYRMVGWSVAKAIAKKEDNGDWLLVVVCNNTYESEGVSSKRPVCVGLISYMEGFYDGIFSKMGGKAVSSREVKCRAMGDPYCVHVSKFRNKDAEQPDWNALEAEWRPLEEELKTK